MSTQSVIMILLLGFVSNAFAASDDIYRSIFQVKTKLAGTSSIETRKKDFLAFYGHVCLQRQKLKPKVLEAHKQFAAGQISMEVMSDVDLERYNYYDLCDFLKVIPLARHRELPANSCDTFLSDLRRSANDEVAPGESAINDQIPVKNEDSIKDLNFQAIQIGKLLYRCNR